MKALILGAILSLCFIGTANATTLDSLASEMTGQPTTVQCVGENGDWDGLVMFSDWNAIPIIYMVNPYCRVLNSVLNKPVAEDWINNPDGWYAADAGWAFHTLVHEVLHIRMNSYDEGEVECNVLYNAWSFIGLLGLDWKARNRTYREAIKAHQVLDKIPPYDKAC